MSELWFPPGFDWKQPDYEPVYQERMARLRKVRSGEINLAALKAFYATHWANFIHDWGMTYDPRNPEVGLPAVVPFLLFPKQREFIQFVYDRWRSREDWLCEKSRDMGVSWLSVGAAASMMLFCPGTVVGFGSRKEEYVDKLGDPKSLFWKVRSFIDLLPDEFKPAGWDAKTCAPFMRILNPENGASIIGEAGDNIGRGARTSIYFKDESAHYEHAEAIDAALSQTSNCKGDISTPCGVGNLFHRKRHGGRIKVFVFDWKDDPRKGKDWYEKQRNDLDPTVLAQEVDRDYNASVEDAFIATDIVKAAMARGPMDTAAVGPVMVGLDVARFGNDKSVLTFRQGRVCQKQEAWGKTDLVDTYGRAKDNIMRWPDVVDQIAVDTIGLGAGVADMLRRDFGERVVDVNSALVLDDGQNFNLRARIWRTMRDWLKAGASIPNDPDLEVQLTALRYSYRAGGALQIESKDDARHRGIASPDKADSIGLTLAIPPKLDPYSAVAAPQAWQVIDEVTGW